jgi:hypothetical protein
VHILPQSPFGWVILIIVVALIFRTVGPDAAGAAVGHALHNLGTAASSMLNSL